VTGGVHLRQGSDGSLDNCGVLPAIPERSNDFLGENRVAPETSQQSDGFLNEYEAWCQIYFHRREMSTDQSANIRNFINTTPMFINFFKFWYFR
jgi:hypothetical protein